MSSACLRTSSRKTITDVGAIGPDRARGGLYLLLPPDYNGPVPQGYYAFKSSTYNVFLFFRTIMGKGEGKPDPAPAVKKMRKLPVFIRSGMLKKKSNQCSSRMPAVSVST